MKIRFFLIIAVCLLLATPVFANTTVTDVFKTMPTGQSIPVEQFEENTVLFEEEPFDRKELAYSLRLPSTWQKRLDESDVIGINSTFLNLTGRYVGPAIGDVRPSLHVRAIRLNREIHVVDWFKDYAMRNGYGVQVVSDVSDNKMRAIYAKFEGGIPFVAMVDLIITGNILTVIDVTIPTHAFDGFKDFQVRVLDSFTMKQPLVGTIEKERRFALLDSVLFHYPKSWVIRRPDFTSLDRLSVEIHRYDRSHILFGQIKILALAKNSKKVDVGAEIAGIVAELSEKDWKVKKLIEKRPAVFSSLYQGGEAEIYDVEVINKDNLDQELWFIYLQNDQYHFFVSMTTPNRKVAYNEWAQNKAVFSKVLATFAPSKKF